MLPTKRKVLTVEEKISFIKSIENGEKQTDVVRRTGISQSTVATIWKDRKKWLDAGIEMGTKKKIRKPQYDDLDRAILQWFKQQRNNHIPLSGPVIKAKAEFYATELGIANFKASEGWLSKWKQRHNINYGQISGEARDVDKNITDDWLQKVWPGMTARYSPEDIFNADETGLFYKMTPNKTLKFKSEKCIGGKLSKERITILVAANMTGSVKRKLLVIGKSKNPRCFKNVKRLPVNYQANKSAWMTSQIFEEEIRKSDCELKGKKILLLVDKCPAHPAIPNLQNIELGFLPANTTNAVQIISRAWAEVTEKTIKHSFRHAGWLEDPVPTEDEDDLSLVIWAQQLELPTTYTPEELQDYENIDETVATAAGVSDEDILNAVRVVVDDEDSEQEEIDPEPEPVPTPLQALEAAKVLRKFFAHHEEEPTASEDASRLEDKGEAKASPGGTQQLTKRKKIGSSDEEPEMTEENVESRYLDINKFIDNDMDPGRRLPKMSLTALKNKIMVWALAQAELQGQEDDHEDGGLENPLNFLPVKAVDATEDFINAKGLVPEDELDEMKEEIYDTGDADAGWFGKIHYHYLTICSNCLQ
ncbi:tigger transposable element-derived protein 4-like [Agrilus planipennis]|uniref:Tigger transposable element-derived protein 4-like n=1 Tax=Agrilus planipennis TaxID=224129 RepID=A0A7F5R7U0_AGRPL|nr:tigger transposable element-derived protein 4-like [Agrilus planipennis]